jgi:outer membrane protein OmpA-like peptidoglycan-associated protein
MTRQNTTYRARMNARLLGILLLVGMVTVTGCAQLSKTERGAAIGAGAGAVVGGAVGAVYGSTARGAIIGAAVGGTAGAVIGQQMDRQARELEEGLDGARVDRVGEGIAISFDSALLFAFDSAELSGTARQNLRRLAESLQSYPNTDLVIVGHTDSVGSAQYNLGLSQRRADSAANYLSSLGVNRARVTTVGKGLTEPIASNETADGREQNRRVEVAIYANEEYRQQIQSRN